MVHCFANRKAFAKRMESPTGYSHRIGRHICVRIRCAWQFLRLVKSLLLWIHLFARIELTSAGMMTLRLFHRLTKWDLILENPVRRLRSSVSPANGLRITIRRVIALTLPARPDFQPISHGVRSAPSAFGTPSPINYKTRP
ncbi:MAG: hypothetical protein BWY82_02224 [Verrucomicrobia bacterium ADurb.Bin474]|nr:MAG: hypothetical protein BWY82_02224 [Verrucomicrobia bacterium ADurb.Bin474]